MMKFAVKQSKSKSTDELILPHFFNARGTAMEHSTEGMYRTLLYWLLGTLPEQTVKELESLYEHHRDRAWQVAELVDALDAALERLGDRPTTFYIDALDECPNDEIRDMLKVFRKIIRTAHSTGQHIRVCFASRPYPHITFTDAVFLDFSKQKEHLDDIQRYIDDELHIGKSEAAQDIRRWVCRKAAGSFMWVVPVVTILNKEYDGGHIDKLSARLSEIPAGLHQLYSYTLERYPENHPALLACCQWLCATLVNVHVAELWWATRWKVDRDENATRKLYETLQQEDMERYIVDVSKGLVEFKGDHNYRYAQFLHESVREFVVYSSEMHRLCGARDHLEFEAICEEAARDCCLAAMESELPTLMKHAEDHGELAIAWTDFVKGWGTQFGHPLVFYAVGNLLTHAEMAQHFGRDQTEFLDEFTKRCGPPYLSPTDIRDLEDGHKVELLHSTIRLLLECDCPEIIRATQLEPARRAWEQGQAFGLVDSGPRSPILRAVDIGISDSLRALVHVYLRLRPRHPELQMILRCLAESEAYYPYEALYPTPAPLLDLTHKIPDLASLILLASTPDGVLDHCIERLKTIFGIKISDNQSQKELRGWHLAFMRFLQALYLLLEEGVSSYAITFGDEVLLNWIKLTTDTMEGEGLLMTPIKNVLDTIEALVRGRQGRALKSP
jgi:hypothetical protein